jgi:hypothetical protein
MNPMRAPGANITSNAPLHKTFATINGQLVHDTAPVNFHDNRIVANNPTLPSQQAARARVREAFGAFRDSQSK